MTLVAKIGGEPAREFRLYPFGAVKTDRPAAGGDFVFTRAMAERAIAWFRSLGRKLKIDYEHQTYPKFNTRPDGLSPAAGWIGGMEVRDDGLWMTQVEWTPAAAEMLRRGEYAYYSPVTFFADEKFSELESLGAVGLTNDPAMCGVQMLAAMRASVMAETGDSARQPNLGAGSPAGSREGPGAAGDERPKEMLMDELKKLLGLPADASEADIITAVRSLTGKSDDVTAAKNETVATIAKALGVSLDAKAEHGAIQQELVAAVKAKLEGGESLAGRVTTLERDNAELRKRAQRAEFEALISGPEHAGKIPPAQAELFFGIFARDRKEFDAVLSAMPKQVGGNAALIAGGAQAGASDGDKPVFLRRIDEVKARDKCSYLVARRTAMKEFAADYAAYTKHN